MKIIGCFLLCFALASPAEKDFSQVIQDLMRKTYIVAYNEDLAAINQLDQTLDKLKSRLEGYIKKHKDTSCPRLNGHWFPFVHFNFDKIESLRIKRNFTLPDNNYIYKKTTALGCNRGPVAQEVQTVEEEETLTETKSLTTSKSTDVSYELGLDLQIKIFGFSSKRTSTSSSGTSETEEYTSERKIKFVSQKVNIPPFKSMSVTNQVEIKTDQIFYLVDFVLQWDMVSYPDCNRVVEINDMHRNHRPKTENEVNIVWKDNPFRYVLTNVPIKVDLPRFHSKYILERPQDC
ncbi:hypothetical protein ACFFRR_008508 [Megaselia abdita]